MKKTFMGIVVAFACIFALTGVFSRHFQVEAEYMSDVEVAKQFAIENIGLVDEDNYSYLIVEAGPDETYDDLTVFEMYRLDGKKRLITWFAIDVDSYRAEYA